MAITIRLKRSKGNEAKGLPDEFYSTIQSGSEIIHHSQLIQNKKDVEKGPRALIRNGLGSEGVLHIIDERDDPKGVKLDVEDFKLTTPRPKKK